MKALQKVAPYPADEEQVTARVMGGHLAAVAQVHFRLGLDLRDRERARRSWELLGAYYAIVRLLRDLAERVGVEQADEAARALHREWDDGEGMPIDLWSWMREYGIDPDAVNQVAEKLVAEAAQAEQSGGAA